MTDRARDRLLHWLERYAFDPVLQADPQNYPRSKRDKLERVKKKTHEEAARFHTYDSAAEIVTNFRRDLGSQPARRIHRELDELGPPTLNELQGEFEQVAHAVGARGG